MNVNAISPGKLIGLLSDILSLILFSGYINTDMNEALIANPTRSRQIMERIRMSSLLLLVRS